MKPRNGMRDGDVLRLWTLYENPDDFPGMFVLREWAVTGDPSGEPRPLPGVFVSPRVEPLREQMIARGLACLARSPNDDPCILECWI